VYVLSDAIEQRKATYHYYSSFHKQLLDMQHKVKSVASYGSKELMRDVELMGEKLPVSRSTALRKRRDRDLRELQSSLTTEILQFESCPDCVAHYYCFEEPDVIPCRKPQ
jgi:hypothetical protein